MAGLTRQMSPRVATYCERPLRELTRDRASLVLLGTPNRVAKATAGDTTGFWERKAYGTNRLSSHTQRLSVPNAPPVLSLGADNPNKLKPSCSRRSASPFAPLICPNVSTVPSSAMEHRVC